MTLRNSEFCPQVSRVDNDISCYLSLDWVGPVSSSRPQHRGPPGRPRNRQLILLVASHTGNVFTGGTSSKINDNNILSSSDTTYKTDVTSNTTCVAYSFNERTARNGLRYNRRHRYLRNGHKPNRKRG